jgi:hypothetical protein
MNATENNGASKMAKKNEAINALNNMAPDKAAEIVYAAALKAYHPVYTKMLESGVPHEKAMQAIGARIAKNLKA